MFSGLVFALLGVLLTTAALSDWEWFWDVQRGKWWHKLFGEEATRGILTILGLGITGTGALVMLGLIR